MTNISEVRAEVQREMQQMLAIVEGDLPERATDVEHALWVAGLQLGASMMRLFFASHAARWPSGRRYNVAGVPYRVEGAEVVEMGTKFGKVERDSAGWAARRETAGSQGHAHGARLALPGGFTLALGDRSSRSSAR